jgi:hypothetical protein
MSKTPRRALVLEGVDVPPLELSRVVEVVMPKKAIFIEEMADGTFRLTYSSSLIPDIRRLRGISLLREDA